jgi:hypothetical protein
MKLGSTNPKNFKLRIVWGFEINEKFYFEYSNSSWVPRVGEVMLLPLKEDACSWQEKYWHKFFVEVVAYDFQNPTTRVICKSLKPEELELQYLKLKL